MASTPTKRPKFRRRAEARPDEVLDAALDLFIARGFAATRVEDIARRAGLSKGAVYLYYPSKEAILEALVQRSILPIAEQVAALGRLETGDPKAALRSLIDLIGDGLAEPRVAAIPKIIVGEAGNFPQLVESYRRQVIERGLGALTALIRRGVELGQFRPVDPELAARNVVGPLIAHLLLARIFSIAPADDPRARRFLDSHLDILMNGLAAEGERKA
ncbi:transcriptional regulator, TetR family [Tistlia consotensis]|uniref:Transcriptional regulator, TetR family n=1 Tax=Tistlia consotensis USBA 355 TaxID=560819 RepID=A0A1Y6CFF4_9PROT|nr:TetR/AcrR family transcriptional regulator [Tistlia consotensis]SMF60330.1 transcriptional regulator, TetR family [Tistlia consotensis USBA 355]SNR93536.1 transcriptional regulator, TetR family [Tistlia consotensis]